MDLTQLISLVSLLAGLSAANERLVQLFKSWMPTKVAVWFFQEIPQPAPVTPKDSSPEAAAAALAQNAAALAINAHKEECRKARVHVLSIFTGIGTALLASPIIANYTSLIKQPGNFDLVMVYISLGFLTSGGAGVWNDFLSYLNLVKGVKEGDDKLSAARIEKAKAEAEKAKAEAEKAKAEAAKTKAEADKVGI